MIRPTAAAAAAAAAGRVQQQQQQQQQRLGTRSDWVRTSPSVAALSVSAARRSEIQMPPPPAWLPLLPDGAEPEPMLEMSEDAVEAAEEQEEEEDEEQPQEEEHAAERGTRVVITASVLFPLDFDLFVAIARHHAREAEEAAVVLSCVHPLPDHRRAPRALPVALSKGGRRRQRWRGGGWRRDGLARLGLGDDLWVGQLADLALFRRRRIDQRAPWAAPTVQLVRFESRHALACRSSSWSVAGRSLFGGRAGLEAPRRRRGTWWRCRILARRRRTRSS